MKKNKITKNWSDVLKRNYLKILLFSLIGVFAIVMITKSFSKGETESEGNIVEITDQSFDNEIAKGLVLVDFWATWCRPCRIQGEILKEVEKESQLNVKFKKMDIDKNPVTAEKFQIYSIPTLILFQNGTLVKTFVGIQEKELIISTLKSFSE